MFLPIDAAPAFTPMTSTCTARRAGRTAVCGLLAGLLVLAVAGCTKAPPPPAPQATPVAVMPVALSSVPLSDSYVATIKSRRTTTLQPQVDGRITRILVHSGQNVAAGQLLLQIDPLKQQASVQQGVATELQQKSQYQYNQADVERQRQLFEAGVISKQAYDLATQSFGSTQGAYNAAVAATRTQREQLAYYQVRAPFAGIVGDIPVHQGDYVSPTTMLTTVDEDRDLEAYIYVPTERASLVHNNLPVELLDASGHSLTKTAIYFVSPQVDNGTQSILAKAPVSSAGNLRNQQIVTARVTWDSKPAATVPVLAVTKIGGASFVYLAAQQGSGYIAHLVGVTLGDPIGNNYPVLTGLKPGDRVILSGLQFLQEGAPVKPLS
ncbi:MAG: efflux RND transporter periplasmic adaptor subunit [Janthinobacterium lividum]